MFDTDLKQTIIRNERLFLASYCIVSNSLELCLTPGKTGQG